MRQQDFILANYIEAGLVLRITKSDIITLFLPILFIVVP